MSLDERQGGVLDCNAIVAARERGDVVIEPFNQSNLAGSSYDVTLGEFFYLEQTPEQRLATMQRLGLEGRVETSIGAHGYHVRQPFDKDDPEITWGPVRKAEALQSGEAISSERGVLIPPGMSVLAHTNEFIGARGVHYTTMMKTRSSMGRSLVDITMGSSGWGDPGYFGRWTMDITITSTHTAVFLPVGARVGQIVFISLVPGPFVSEEVQKKLVYTGKYQSSQDLAELQANWSPAAMLPRLHLDSFRQQ
ncbi:MAG: hypothetical protein K2X36_02955 [Microbacteriaceae bacterium]|nr:hypothetical protein [Microbacteriaceae bacterium]